MNRQYIVTERAHLMCPNMQFGICAKMNADYEETKLEAALKELQDKHPFLHSYIAKEQDTGKLYYDTSSNELLDWTVKNDVNQLFQDYSELIKNGWNVFKEHLLKVIVYPNDHQVLFVAHHLLCDGRGLLNLMLEFCDLYAGNIHPKYAEECLIKSIEDLPPKSDLAPISRFIVNNANKNWHKENHKVSYAEYIEFEKKYLRENPVTYEVKTVHKEELDQLNTACREHGVSINDYLVADMMQKQKTNKVIIAADIRKQLSCYHEGALGNYATAMGIISKKRTENVMEKAKHVKQQIQKRMAKNQGLMQVLACYISMEPELLDAVTISTLGNYESKAAAFVGTNMFGYKQRAGYSISNLGKVENPNIVEAIFIPPASPANHIMEGVLSVNGTMKICRINCHD